MAYDEQMAENIRGLMAGEPKLTEQKMFGGLAFLIGGKMAVAVSGEGGLLVRIDPSESEKIVAATGATPMVMRGRQMKGWLRVGADEIRTKRQLRKWVELGLSYAGGLPIKKK